MKIDILGTESLAVRGLSCVVTLRDRKILIDPGIALGWHRHGYLPHPLQIAIGCQVRDRIISELDNATDVVFSHFDGDHVPLPDPNPYQLGLNSVKGQLAQLRIWAKGAEPSSKLANKRRSEIEDALNRKLEPAEGVDDGGIKFSRTLLHGLRSKKSVSIMMTRIEENGFVFVHASDHQFLHEESVAEILALSPTVVLSSGPPLYLEYLNQNELHRAKQNAVQLSNGVRTLIIDHHLLRSESGLDWIKGISDVSGKEVVCAAKYMGKKPMLLEARREELYERMPVPDGWHEAYAA
jgi:predicted metallo-beta-lactamase superfamily hydrolase